MSEPETWIQVDVFLEARLNEEQRIADIVERSSLGPTSRLTHYIDAQRKIIASYRDALGPDTLGGFSQSAAGGFAWSIAYLATVYRDHPDFERITYFLATEDAP